MMQNQNPNDRNQETVVLTRAVENLFRKLVRFLIGRISLIRLQEIIRYIFVEETENKLRQENPTKNVPLSKLALLSGLDTRTLTKIRNSKRYRKPFHKEASFLQEFVPGASVLHVWSSMPPYVDPITGESIKLNISGKQPSFESLFLESTKSRGVTFKTLLERLIESGAVSHDENDDRVALITESYLPSDSKDKLGAIEMGFAALGNLTDTVTKNICALETNGVRIFQRGIWTHRLQLRFQKELRSELNEFLEQTDHQARKIIKKYEDKSARPEQLTVGVSFFYFEEESQ